MRAMTALARCSDLVTKLHFAECGSSSWTRTVVDERSEFAIEPEFRTRRPLPGLAGISQAPSLEAI